MSLDQISFYKQKLKSAHDDIDPQAIGIIKRLKESNFDGYIVGGAVRDLLVGLKPKDFDIATNALPNEVKKKVSYCFIIGRRFKLVHARRGDKIFEIATYRREPSAAELSTEVSIDLPFVEENFFGNLKEDSFRRDFTVNALFYDPTTEELVDHCNGLTDIHSQTLRMIGDPTERIKEDPIRILRAIRLSQKLTFQLESTLREAILINSEEIQKGVSPRRREEWIKFFRLENIESALWDLFDLDIFKHVLPSFHELFQNESQREEFLCYTRKFDELGFNFNDTVELFAAVIYSYLLATNDHYLKIKIRDLSEDKKFQDFCKDELGAFKAEMISIEICIGFIYYLTKKETYLTKGERRQKALLNNPHFNLAVKLGLLSGELTSIDFDFWMSEKERYSNPAESDKSP
jgi:poly(A) polymerase